MIRLILPSIFLLVYLSPIYAQTTPPSSTATAAAAKTKGNAGMDSARFAKLIAIAQYPLIQSTPFSGVLPVADATEKPDPSLQYKLVMNLTEWEKDAASLGKVNGGLVEICRLINLHAAAGIPKKNMEVVTVVHAGALFAFLTNQAYRDSYNQDNPNLTVIRQLMGLGVKFIACGQAKQFLNIPTEKMIPEISTALTAQVMLSSYQLKGFVRFDINGEK